MKAMRQHRYAIDLSECNLTIVHRAGAVLRLPDALSRLGYDKGQTQAALYYVEETPVADCTVEKLREAFSEDASKGHMKQRTDAASYGKQDAMKLCKQLELANRIGKAIPESDEETARAIEMYNMASLVTLKSKSKKSTQQGAKVEEVGKAAEVQETIHIEVKATEVQGAIEIATEENTETAVEVASKVQTAEGSDNKRMLVASDTPNISREQPV